MEIGRVNVFDILKREKTYYGCKWNIKGQNKQYDPRLKTKSYWEWERKKKTVICRVDKNINKK